MSDWLHPYDEGYPHEEVMSAEPMTDSIRVPLGDLRALDDKHFPTTRAKRPDWEVCEHDSMTWPCDTEKALRAFADYYEQACKALDAATARALAAEEALADMVNQFAYWSDGATPGLVTGGLSALEGAFAVLGYDEPHPADHQRCDEPGCTQRSSSGWPSPSGYRRTCHEHTDYHINRQCNWPADSPHWAAANRTASGDEG